MIQHESFLNICLKDKALLDRCFNTLTLKDFLKNIEKETESTYESIFKNTFETRHNMIGDLFEIFAECFFTILQGDNRAGVFDYKPGKKSDDNGVDGYGIGIDGKPATVQVKYRGNVEIELKERDIKNFGFQSIIMYGVDKDTSTNMIVFTSAKGLHWHTESNVAQGRIRTINNETISKMIDNNHCFWLAAQKLITDSHIT
jgi:hypothetical protein